MKRMQCPVHEKNPSIIDNSIGAFEQGMLPTVSELAAHAGVSRQPHIVIFPQSDLISATVDASLAPIIAWTPTPEDNTTTHY